MELDQSCYEKTKTKTYFYHLLLVLQHAQWSHLKISKTFKFIRYTQYHTPTEVGTTQQIFKLELQKQDGKSSMAVDHFLFSNWTVVCVKQRASPPLMCYLTDWLHLATNARVSYQHPPALHQPGWMVQGQETLLHWKSCLIINHAGQLYTNHPHVSNYQLPPNVLHTYLYRQ